MPASKPPLVTLFPALLAVPLMFSSTAQAQKKTAAMTPPMRPVSTIAPRQNLPQFTSVKATEALVVTSPSASQSIPLPVKEAALPAPNRAQTAATLSARERAPMIATDAVSATPPIAKARQRRTFAKAVSLSSSPNDLIKAETPAPILAPVAPVPVAAIEPLPLMKAAPRVARPSILASREAKARELALARLDAQLAGAEVRLDRAQSRLTEGQRQLGSVNNLLQNAMLSSGGSGLHPFVRVAQRYLGTPYVWGGESARGFDCSGFIMRVMRDLGYKALPHSAAEQFNYGKPISKGLLKAGDIVFFANTYKPGISHVGIYLGGGRFIHAANSQVGTIVSNLNESKWVEKYAGARRLMKAG